MTFADVKDWHDRLEELSVEIAEHSDHDDMDRWMREELFRAQDRISEARDGVFELAARRFTKDRGYVAWGLEEGWLDEVAVNAKSA